MLVRTGKGATQFVTKRPKVQRERKTKMEDQHVSARTHLGSLQQNTLSLSERRKYGRRTRQRSTHACRLIMRHLQRHHRWCYSRALMHWRLNSGQSLKSSILCAHNAPISPLQTNAVEQNAVGAALEEAAPPESAVVLKRPAAAIGHLYSSEVCLLQLAKSQVHLMQQLVSVCRSIYHQGACTCIHMSKYLS